MRKKEHATFFSETDGATRSRDDREASYVQATAGYTVMISHNNHRNFLIDEGR